MFAASKTASVSGGYQISRSLRFNSADSAYLTRTPASATNRRTYTWSGWVKRSALGSRNGIFVCVSAAGTIYTGIEFNSSDQLVSYDSNASGTTSVATTQVFRDVSAWYHIVWAYDTTQATGSNRVKLYVNGVQITSFAATDYPPQNSNSYINSNNPHSIGSWVPVSPALYLNAYMTEANFIDGTQLTPSSFGETNAQTGVWQPKAYSGSYGTNGFYLNFSDNSNTTDTTLGKDYSGNGNNWTPTGFSVSVGAENDSLVDSPTSYGTDTGVGGTVRGNYATFNPLSNGNTLANGNLQLTGISATWGTSIATIGMSSGKWYCEATVTSISGTLYARAGIATQAVNINSYLGVNIGGWGYISNSGNKEHNTSSVAYGSSWTSNDVIGIAFDADVGTLTFYKNNISQGTAYTSLTSGPYFFAFSINDPSVMFINFGQRPFAYTAPSGFKALCTQNLPTPTIGATTATLANTFFAPALYTGNDGTQTVTTGIDMATSGGLVWFKNRSAAVGHALINPVVGYGSFLQSNSTGAENAFSFITATSSTGFTMNTGSSTFNGGAAAGGPFAYVAWNWKANGSGSSNTAGSITSTVSANTTSGFSVVTWTGNGADASIGHGLGVAPSMVIQKFRGAVSNWSVYTSTTGAGKRLKLNSTDAVVTDGSFPTTPTSTVFYINGGSNDNGVTMVAYCFAPIAGYSAFGSYTGNGSADGPFVFTGFRPAFIMIKSSSYVGSEWVMLDVKRNTYNVINLNLYANASTAEATDTRADANSNGFKIRGTGTYVNNNSDTYIFMAFAENPFKYSLAR